ncbi:MAG: choline-sulfatase [Actinomycetales bacterium]
MSARPNILVLMYDQIAPRALGCYGNPVTHAPTIDRLSAEGVTFDAAYTNSPLCTPARYCFMSGQLPSATRGYDNAAYLASVIPTFAHYLRAGGYRTILSGKMHFVGADQLHGFEERRTTDIYPADFGWTPDWRAPSERVDWWYHNMDSVVGAGVAEVTNQLLFDDEVGQNARRALHDVARSDDERPWMIVASFTHPHDPYVTRRQYWDLYQDKDIPLPVVKADQVEADPHTLRLREACAMEGVEITDDHIRSARRAYYGNISYVDDWSTILLNALSDLQLAEDTIVVVLADHGDMLGERGLWYKMNFFEDSTRIPLIVHNPKRFRPGRVSEPVSLVDVLPSLLELTGTDTEVADPLAGRSFAPLLTGEVARDASADSSAQQASGDRYEVIGEYMAEGSCAPIVMIRRGRWKFVHCPADPDQLYDLAEDPLELDNLAGRDAHAGTVARFRAEVAGRWDLDRLTADILTDQARRRVVSGANRVGKFTPWDYRPLREMDQEYMRNHLDLNEVERLARWPR